MKPADSQPAAVLSARQISQLWQTHAAALLLLARSRCRAAEDCVQQAFVRLAAMTPPPDNPVAWLAAVVRNEAVSVARSESRRRRREAEVAADEAAWFHSQQNVVDGLAADEAQRALEQLDQETREIIIARIWAGLTFRDIAVAFDTSHATAQRRYESGIAELRRRMEVFDRPGNGTEP